MTIEEMDFQQLLDWLDKTRGGRTTIQLYHEDAETEWKVYITNYIQTMQKKIETLQSKNADLKRTNEAIQKATAQDILQQMWNWKDRGTPFIADIQELADRYGVEVEQ